MELSRYKNMKNELQKVIDNTEDSMERARLIDVMRVLDLIADSLDKDNYGVERNLELIYEILS